MSYAAGVFLGVVACAISILAFLQVYEYLRGRSLLTRRHLFVRVAAAVLMLAAIAGIFAGVLIELPSPLAKLAYWCGVMGLVLAVFVLAFIDLRMLELVKHQRRAELFRKLAEVEDALRRLPEDAE